MTMWLHDFCTDNTCMSVCFCHGKVGLKITIVAKITVKPVLSDHIKQDIFLAFQTGGCLLLHESSAESWSFLCFFHSAISTHLSIQLPCELNGKSGLTV